MMTYLLLRNNKESGPFSLEGLREAELSPNDLVWVEGQSVCWLRPSEIQELKSMVSASAKRSTQNASVEKTVVEAETRKAEKKKIHGSLPSTEKKETLNSTAYSAYQPVPESGTTIPPITFSAAKEETTVAETKYSRPLDELKELYAKDLENRLRKKRVTLHLPPAVRKAGLYSAFLLVGLIAGILIRNSGKDKNNVISSAKPAPPAATVENPVTGNVETDSIPEPVTPENAIPVQSIVEPSEPLAEIPPATKERSIKKTSTARETTTDAGTTDKDIPARTDAKQNTREAVVSETRKTGTAELAAMVTVKSNDYIVGSFGGIKNLQLTVSNSSAYKLDRVTVELQYLKPLDEFLKSENIVFNSIPPGSSQTMSIPKSSRGVKVRYRVTRIESDEVSGNTAGN